MIKSSKNYKNFKRKIKTKKKCIKSPQQSAKSKSIDDNEKIALWPIFNVAILCMRTHIKRIINNYSDNTTKHMIGLYFTKFL